ncbi:MAG: type II CAAX prenyl endopeptidase Rce1 family protein [Nitriliruptoraceae bacterium]
MRWLWPVWNRRERRVRAAWRIVAMLAVYLLLTIVTMAAVETWLPDHERLAAPVAIVVTGTLAASLPARYLDRRPLSELGLGVDRVAVREFGVGLVLGLMLTGGVLIVYLAAGWASVTGWFVAEDGGFVGSFALLLAMYAAVAYLEELLFRGYFITNLTEGLSSVRVARLGRRLPARWQVGVPVVLAVVVSSLVFADFHGDELTALEYLHFWLAGVLLAVPYVVTGRLALPIGLHLTFNLGMTGLFNVEGGLPAVVRLEIDGPSPLVGEAGLVETGLIVVTLLVTILYLRFSGRPMLPAAGRAAARDAGALSR